MYKIAFCGSHGTGKTTLLQTISQELHLPIIDKTIRTYWKSIGVDDFEKLPADVRTQCQLNLLLNQIEREDTEGKDGFITDRSVLDYIGYTAVSSDMKGAMRGIYEQLIRERLSNYTHFIYLPVEFEAKKEHLRADPSNQVAVAQAMEHYISQWMSKDSYVVARGSVEERLAQIHEFLKSSS
jgi:deoxyadenosine/deoxycytidine kinase